MYTIKSAPLLTIIVLIAGIGMLAFRMYQDIALDEPAPVAAFMNGAFPERVGAAFEVASEPRPTDRALSITPEPLGDRVFVAEQVGRIYTLYNH